MDKTNVKALCFDLGNTLIEFGPRQIAQQCEILTEVLLELFGSCDGAKLEALRKKQLMAPYENGYRENDLAACGAELIRELYEIEPEEHQVAAMVAARYRAFMEGVEAKEEVLELLRKLRGNYRLALLSNYPCGRSIRDAMERTGLAEFFEVIVVSGEVGYVKPHRRPYELMLEGLGLMAEECVYVGDNWLADVQGAKGMGMHSVLTTQHVPYEVFPRKEGDHEPDAQIGHLGELEEVFL